MGMETTTTSNKRQSPLSPDGTLIGQSATDLVGFFGATPVVQPTATAQSAVTAVTDGSGGAASATTGVQALTSSYNSTLLSNALATIIAQGNANKVLVNQLRSDLVTLGVIKGS